MRISDWISDLCSSDLGGIRPRADKLAGVERAGLQRLEHIAPAQRLHRHAEPRAHLGREAGGAEAQALQVVDGLDLVAEPALPLRAGVAAEERLEVEARVVLVEKRLAAAVCEPATLLRSVERRVGKEGVRAGRSRGSPSD